VFWVILWAKYHSLWSQVSNSNAALLIVFNWCCIYWLIPRLKKWLMLIKSISKGVALVNRDVNLLVIPTWGGLVWWCRFETLKCAPLKVWGSNPSSANLCRVSQWVFLQCTLGLVPRPEFPKIKYVCNLQFNRSLWLILYILIES